MLSLAMDRIVIVSMCTFDRATESVSVIITSRCPPAQMHLGSRDKDHEDAVLGFDGAGIWSGRIPSGDCSFFVFVSFSFFSPVTNSPPLPLATTSSLPPAPDAPPRSKPVGASPPHTRM
ncbi:hypothetical protein Hypma_003271 [Hypsizygus marmoreus]|uniref:Uncharacterized protein n=1 Tax=Hypsizygus marmoreus TaxID=39966 RepID=A0A369K780_HYPMA|nr:hypothetical protein Hypma_003271 [Hypsizygus marmoreus]